MSLRICALGPAIACAILCLAGLSQASPPPLNAELADILRREVPRDCVVSIQVMDLETGQILMEANPDRPLIPASTMKVVTSAAALSTLGPEFQFVTEVFVENASAATVGNLYLKGRGDPYLVSEQLFALTRDIREKGLEEIRGDIVVDDSYFIPGKPLDEQEALGPRSYHAPYSALSLNFNTVHILAHPGSKPGSRARVIAGPKSEYALVRDNVGTVKGKGRGKISVTKGWTKNNREVFRVKGTIGVAAPTKSLYVNVANPTLFAGKVFKEFLSREGIKVSGNVKQGRTPATAVPFLEFKSRPLGVIVYWLNKFSSNFMAEQISMAMGAEVLGAPGTRAKGLAVIRKFLKESGVPESNFTLSEASGLSRRNRVSASALVKVLMRSEYDFAYGAEFRASLGVAGVDGTLKERFVQPHFKRRIRAKTGSLRGVTSLAGYGISPGGRVFAFAVLVNRVKQGGGFMDYAEKVVKKILRIRLSGTSR